MTTCTAAWSADRLVSSLQAHGWGELDGAANAGLQRVLHALVSLLPYDSAQGHLTRAQVADAASMSPKWAGVCLRRLEELGVITWRRGWLDHGQPRAGHIRVLKTRLAEMVRAARGYLDERRERRRVATAHRLETTLTKTTVPPWNRRRGLSRRWELSSTLPIQGRTAHRAPGDLQPSPTLPGVDVQPDLTCKTCGRGPDQCHAADAKLPQALRHTYEPAHPDRGRLVLTPERKRQLSTRTSQRRTFRERPLIEEQ